MKEPLTAHMSVEKQVGICPLIFDLGIPLSHDSEKTWGGDDPVASNEVCFRQHGGTDDV